MSDGRTLGQLVEQEGRDALQRRVAERARKDRVFAQDLAHRPRQTLEQFLGVRIPEVVSVTAIVEDPRTFGIVVPQADS